MPAAIIYPRGFIGFDIGAVKTQSNVFDFLQTVRGIEFNRNIKKEINSFPSNPEVDLLWKSYTTGADFTSKFSFREKIIKTALAAFGTKSFQDWVELQERNPYLSPLHKKFINDTFNFLKEGKRSVDINTWLNILSTESTRSVGDTGTNVNSKDYFVSWGGSKDTSMVAAVVEWSSKPMGFEDLLGTLAVLFGAIK